MSKVDYQNKVLAKENTNLYIPNLWHGIRPLNKS